MTNKIKNADKPAMPQNDAIISNVNILPVDCLGLTKREMFAMHFMAANRSRNSDYASWADMALDSIEMADALLKELEK